MQAEIKTNSRQASVGVAGRKLNKQSRDQCRENQQSKQAPKCTKGMAAQRLCNTIL